MSRNSALPLVLAFAALSLGGCAADYLNHYDTVSLAAGDAQKANRLLHTTNPDNPVSHNTAIETDGRRTADAVERYRNSAKADPGQQQPNVTINFDAETK